MSDFKGEQLLSAPDGSAWALGLTEFGGFSPDTVAGAEMIRLIGESGATGAWLAGQLKSEAARQQEAAAAKEIAAAIRTSFQPQAPDINRQWLVMFAAGERGATEVGDGQKAEYAREGLRDASRQLAEEGLIFGGKVRDMIIQARRESRAQLS